ncbi:ice-binding family protein [Flavobacterium sp. ENC]|uniref:ice-binding family protein n=1 Tax=Flavobacterium sp. ENC TaxID=2897330 RepID=UPI001E57152A|nr:ice-binding family protein [Flavobacterium sp. ENC]MCD0465215.1 ice-binding family protein [Flavobacterium sp. ENC]
MKIKILIVAFAIVCFAFITGCENDDFEAVEGVCPVVESTTPLSNAINVPLEQVITVTFNEEMDPASITSTSFTVTGTTPLAGAVTYSGRTASFKPAVLLAENTSYTARITTKAKDVMGNFLQVEYVWVFSTGTLLRPAVTATDPLNNAVNVALNQTVTADFSILMDAASINATTFTLKQGAATIAGTVSYSGTTASFKPANSLVLGKIYTATITTGAKSAAGTSLAADYVWNFTTMLLPPAPLVIDLGSAAMFGAFGGNAGITNQGLNTVINNGSLGTTAASTLITGFHDGLVVYTETPLNVGNVTGDIFSAPPVPGTATSLAIAQKGLLDANAAYLSISPAAKPGGSDPNAGELGGLTLAPGVYKSASGTFKISNGDLTLDAQGDPNATWIFQTASGLTVGIAGPTGAKSVIMKNGALPKNVFWYVGSAATINSAGGGTMVGTIIANSGVTFSTAGNANQTVLNGRAISLVASVTMVNTTVNVP